MNDLKKLQLLLPHWIEHNQEHAQEFQAWAERMQGIDKADLAESLLAAAASLQQAGDHLSNLLGEVGQTVGT